jgi:hypothetical protein
LLLRKRKKHNGTMLPKIIVSSVLTAPAKTKVHENGVYHIWENTILFLARSGTIHVEGTHPVYLSYLSNCTTSYLEHILSWKISCCHTVFPYYSLFWPMQVVLSLWHIRRQSKHSFCPQSDKMLLIFNTGLDRMTLWIIIIHMVTWHYIHLPTWDIRSRGSCKPQCKLSRWSS